MTEAKCASLSKKKPYPRIQLNGCLLSLAPTAHSKQQLTYGALKAMEGPSARVGLSVCACMLLYIHADVCMLCMIVSMCVIRVSGCMRCIDVCMYCAWSYLCVWSYPSWCMHVVFLLLTYVCMCMSVRVCGCSFLSAHVYVYVCVCAPVYLWMWQCMWASPSKLWPLWQLEPAGPHRKTGKRLNLMGSPTATTAIPTIPWHPSSKTTLAPCHKH